MAESKTPPKLMLGNEAIARGAIEAGARFVSCYPGTPSSEVVEALLSMRNANEGCSCDNLDIEYSVNEKVAMETACGAALAGAPSLVTMKHVGLNVAADPLFTAAYTGMPGGLVVLSADDPGCHSSQNEQDNRNYARAAHLPCFEPVSAEECRAMTREAFTVARDLEQPVLLRATTRVSHSRGPVWPKPCDLVPVPYYKPTASRFVPVPAVAKGRHRALAAQMEKAAALAEKSQFNNLIKLPALAKDGRKYGIIASGVARSYLADALVDLGLDQEIGVLELGMTWPLPRKLINDFLINCTDALILEEGAPILENDIRSLAKDIPVAISGKDKDLTEFGEYSLSLIRARLNRWLGLPANLPSYVDLSQKLPQRPPNLCPGCAHRAVYYAARKVFGDNALYSSDIGCYTLGLLPPLKTADFLVCMGSSVSAGSGYARAAGKPVVAFIGDSTFFHSGITGLANAVFNKHDILLVILDNGTTAMTGHQPNPGMAQEKLGAAAQHMDIESLLTGLGITQKRTVRSHNLNAVTKAFTELASLSGVRVLLAQDPCRLSLGKKRARVAKVRQQGSAAEKCLQELACPAFTRKNGELAVDEELCSGCMLCVQIAPEAFAAKNPALN